MSRKVRSLLALVVLTLFLGTGAAHALPEGRHADRGPGMLVAVWEWVSSLLEGRVPFLQTQQESAGAPDLPAPPTTKEDPDGDFGGFIDPNG